MSTPTSRLAALVRQHRSGVQRMPEMDLSRSSKADELSLDDINSVGETPMVMPEMDLSQPEKRLAVDMPTEADISAANPELPQDRHARLMAAIQRTQQAPEQPSDPVDPAQNSPRAMMAKLATGAAMPKPAPATPVNAVQVDSPHPDRSLYDAQEADRKSRFTAGMELAGRQLVGAITRTDVPQGIGASPSQVPFAIEQGKERRQALVDALNRKRQGELDAEKKALDVSTIDKNASEAEKNRRLPPEKTPTPTNALGEETLQVRRDKLAFDKEKLAAKAKPKTVGTGPSPDFDSNVKSIAAYDRDPPTPKQDPGGHIMAAVRRMNPKWNQAEYDAYRHARVNQATNPHLNSAQASREHLDELKAAVAAEDAGMFDNPTINGVARGVAEKSGKATYTRKVTAAKVVGAEIAGALEENDKEGKAMVQKLVDPDQSKEQWSVSIPTLEKLRDEKLGIYAKRAAKPGSDGASQAPTKREYVKELDGFGYFYDDGKLKKEKIGG